MSNNSRNPSNSSNPSYPSYPSNPSKLMSELQRLDSQKLPPVDQWHPDLCDNVVMRIDAQGQWYYQDSPIARQAMIKLFTTVIRRDGPDEYYLVTPVEKILLEVADVPFQIVDFYFEDQILHCVTDTDTVVIVNSENQLTWRKRKCNDDFAPYVAVRSNLEAVFNRSSYYRLLEHCLDAGQVTDAGQLKVVSANQTYILG